MKPIFLAGNRLYLRPLLETDVQGRYIEWLNDPEVCEGNSHHFFPYSPEKGLHYIREINHSHNQIVLAMVHKEENIHIGNIALQKIHWQYRTAEFAILLGEKKFWGQGLALEASQLIVQHGFEQLNLNRIDCATFEKNLGMQKLAKSLGMVQEGLRRNAVYKNGSYQSIVEFGLLREEFIRNKP